MCKRGSALREGWGKVAAVNILTRDTTRICIGVSCIFIYFLSTIFKPADWTDPSHVCIDSFLRVSRPDRSACGIFVCPFTFCMNLTTEHPYIIGGPMW